MNPGFGSCESQFSPPVSDGGTPPLVAPFPPVTALRDQANSSQIKLPIIWSSRHFVFSANSASSAEAKLVAPWPLAQGDQANSR